MSISNSFLSEIMDAMQIYFHDWKPNELVFKVENGLLACGSHHSEGYTEQWPKQKLVFHNTFF